MPEPLKKVTEVVGEFRRNTEEVWLLSERGDMLGVADLFPEGVVLDPNYGVMTPRGKWKITVEFTPL